MNRQPLDMRHNLENIFFALVNTKEFTLQH